MIDFCYAIEGRGFTPVKEYLAERNLSEEFCGLIPLPTKNLYVVFYDRLAQLEKKVDFQVCSALKYKGICDSESILISHVPEEESPMFYMFFDRDSYEKNR